MSESDNEYTDRSRQERDARVQAALSKAKAYARMHAGSPIGNLLKEVHDALEETLDRAHMAEIYRPEITPETVAVNLDDESNWDTIADWCGGVIHTTHDPSGDYSSTIHIPASNAEAWNGCWIVRHPDNTFSTHLNIGENTHGSSD